MNPLLKAVAIFFLVFVADIVWSLYIKSIADDKKIMASSMAALIMLVSGSVTWVYVQNILMLIPAALGGFCGTYVVLYFKNKNKPAT